MPQTITVLDQNTINKIAAGEVIERPASVVKELLENAIDAKATAVTVEIKDGGATFIRVTDNGSGIPRDQIALAFLSHATSKIQSVEDLFTVSSLGFRGEALSSIAAVSQVELITKTSSAVTGARYQIHGGKEQSLEEIGAPEGTTFIARNLFYNTPARRKFLKTPMTEGSHVADLVEKIALSHPEVSIRFIQNNQNKLHTSGNHNIKDIIYTVYGREIAANLLPVTSASGKTSISGFIGKPVIARGNRNYENYFINGRYIRSSLISKAIEEAYKPYMMQHKYPFTMLYFSIDPEALDVNVHPTKMELRFSDGELVFKTVLEAVSDALAHKELIPEVELGDGHKAALGRAVSGNAAGAERMPGKRLESDTRVPGRTLTGAERILEKKLAGTEVLPAHGASFLDGDFPDGHLAHAATAQAGSPSVQAERSSLQADRPSIQADRSSVQAGSSTMQTEPLSVQEGSPSIPSERSFERAEPSSIPSEPPRTPSGAPSRTALAPSHAPKRGPEPFEKNRIEQTAPVPSFLQEEGVRWREVHVPPAGGEDSLPPDLAPSPRPDPPKQLDLFDGRLLEPKAREKHELIGQLFDTYWLVEYNDQLYIIDQHAAHEKVLYERTMASLKTREYDTQMVNPPIILTLSMNEEVLLKKHMEYFTGIGFEIEPFGGREYAVRGVPSNLLSIAKKELLMEMIDSLSDDTAARDADMIYERVASMSCKAAVKGNHRMSAAEANELINQLLELENPYACPHGRPTIISMSRYELEKKFKRIV